MLRITLSFLLVTSLSTLGCGADSVAEDEPSPGVPQGGKFDSQQGEGLPSVCAGIRGNGELIFAHFASLARLSEHYGLLDAAAGGSSASITIFLTESMYLNSALRTCREGVCSREEAGVRAAFMFKSLQGYAGVLATTEEGVALMQLGPIVQQATADGIGALFADGNLEEGRQALVALFESDDLKSIINPEVLALLTESPDPAFHAQEIWDALSGFGSFAADDPKILIRPGILDFAQIGRKLGRIANFYAAYGADPAGWADLLDQCAAPTKGLSWAEAAAHDADGSTCGDRFGALAGAYREMLLADEAAVKSRIDDPVSGSLTALISTSVLTGKAVETFETARADYLAARPFTLDVDFDDIRFGYWGDENILADLGANPTQTYDEKTGRFMNLGTTTWATALSFSPAEPGLARALEIDDSRVSAGGWSDLAPTLVLRNMGCEKVIYVTRKGGESNFAQSVAKLLGMTIKQQNNLFALNQDSSFRKSIDESDAVWCTDWNAFQGTDIAGISADAYNAPLQTRDPHFTEGKNAYVNVTNSADAPGCTSGVLPAAE